MSDIYQLNGKDVYNYNGGVYDAHTAALISGAPAAPNPFASMTPVQNEPAVLSSVSGENNFNTKVQPIIDTANKIVQTAAQLKATRDAAAATPKPADPNAVPPDVQAELDAAKAPEQKVYEARMANYDAQEQAAKDTYNSLTLAAKTSAQAQIATLTTQWQQRRALLEQNNKGNEANWTQQFIRTGQAEYSPGMSGDLLTQKEQEGIAKVKSLDDDYNTTVNEINAAVEQNNFKRAAQLTSDLQTIESNALSTMQENAKQATSVNNALRTQQMTQARDSAIASLIGNGVTDAAKILDVLTKNGYSTNAADVADTIKNLTISGNTKDLSADLATFKYVRDNFGLPEDIAKLPPEQQYFAYLQKVKQASSATGGDFTLSTNQIRYDAAGNPIAYGKQSATPAPKKKTDPTTNVPTWDEYLAAAQKAAGVNYFMAPEEDQLRAQYDSEYGGNREPFTATELKKIEQAGLQNATRKEQLNFLYGKKSSESPDTADLPAAIR